MPTLDWIGKEAVVGHHREIPYRLLECDPALSVGEPGQGNLLVEGDNLHALKALLPYYAGQVKCIYIDPPYNTGEERWVYNDSVNSPEMRRWLGTVVGKHFEDLSRSDKWLCMVYPRLRLLREFLAEDGAIFVSLDDNAIALLRLVMDEIFGEDNFVASAVWQKRTSPDARLPIGPAHDYIAIYARDIAKLKPTINRIPLSGFRSKDYRNPDDDHRGPWASVDLTGQIGHATDAQYYSIPGPNGSSYPPPPGRCWAIAESTIARLIEEGRLWFGKDGNARPRLKKFLSETQGTTSWTWWPNSEVGHNQEATKELLEIMDGDFLFDNPKPTRLLRRIMQLATSGTSIVLDSFAGSGTTAHAVMQMNKEDGGNRRFILVEMERDICRNITAERLKRAAQGYSDTPGLGGGFRYCTLGEPVFDERGQITKSVRFADLARHVFFSETGEPAPSSVEPDSPLVGVHNGTAVYLLYNGILGDKSVNGGNVLTSGLLRSLPPHAGPKVIYGEGCRVTPEKLKRLGVVFRQIPYEIKES